MSVFLNVIFVLLSHQKKVVLRHFPLTRPVYEPHTCNCNVWCKLAIGFLQEISNLEKKIPVTRFSKLTKFSANCHLANDWSCFVEHKL